MAKKIEVEKGELIIRNDSGDVAIIPSRYRVEVLGMLDDGCFDCIDNFVSELPKYSDYEDVKDNKDEQ